MRLTEKVTRNVGILRRELTGKSLGFVGSNPTPAEIMVGEKRFYYCDNWRHPHGEIVQVLTYERDPKCPICLGVMTYGSYW